MAESASAKSRFKSLYGGAFCTPAQYITERICERIAAKDKKNLPAGFWNTAEWKKTYKMQLLKANSLLKMYSVNAIIAGLKRCPSAYSLHAKWLDKFFEEEQRKYEAAQAKKEEQVAELIEQQAKKPVEVVTEPVKPRPQFLDGKSNLSKLRSLD